MRRSFGTNNSNNTDNSNNTNNANNTNTTSPVARFIHALPPLLFTNLRFHPRYLAHLLHYLRLTCLAQSRDANAIAATARAMHSKQANRTTPV